MSDNDVIIIRSKNKTVLSWKLRCFEVKEVNLAGINTYPPFRIVTVGK